MKRNHLTLMLLALLFMCPGLAAYLFFNHPQWLGASAINKGTLLNPPEVLANLNSKPKWRLILWYPKPCDQLCYQHLDQLGRIRLGLGRRLYDVEEWLVTPNQPSVLTSNARKNLYDHDMHVLLLSDEQRQYQRTLTNQAQIFIANPEDYLVLSYELTAKPDDIFHDLRQLLTSIERKSG